MSKQAKDKPDGYKRETYLEVAMTMNRLLDRRYFPKVVEALKKRDKGKGAFAKLCKDIEIPDAMVDMLWKTLLGVSSEMALEPGWIPGT